MAKNTRKGKTAAKGRRRGLSKDESSELERLEERCQGQPSQYPAPEEMRRLAELRARVSGAAKDLQAE